MDCQLISIQSTIITGFEIYPVIVEGRREALMPSVAYLSDKKESQPDEEEKTRGSCQKLMEDLDVLVGKKAVFKERLDPVHVVGNIKNDLLECAEQNEAADGSPQKL